MQLDIQTSMSALVLLGALTPMLTAILTRLRDPDWFKGLVSMTAVVGVGVLSSFENSGEFTLSEVLQSGAAAWGVHLATYFGVTKDMVTNLSKATVKFAPIALKRSTIR